MELGKLLKNGKVTRTTREPLTDTLNQPIEKREGRKVAVRVISLFGEESTKILTID